MKQMSPSFNTHIRLFGLLLLIPILTLVTAMLVYDPLQLFFRHQDKLNTNMRWQNAGIFRHHLNKFDAVIFGTSVFEASSANEASKLFHEKFANLSVTASDYYERYLMLSSLLKKKQIKTVIYSLDDVYRYQRKGYATFPIDSWAFLYDDNKLNDLQIYLNAHYLTCLSQWSTSPKCAGEATTLDKPNDWSGQESQTIRFGGLANWLSAKNDPQVNYDLKTILNYADAIRHNHPIDTTYYAQATVLARQYVDDYLLTLIKRYPKTNFKLIFPPYSRARFAMWHQFDHNSAMIHHDIVRYLVTVSRDYPNMQVYGFEDHEYLDDLANYKDLVHYHPSINSRVQHAIAKQQGLLTQQNVDAYLDTAKDRALKFDLLELADSISPHLN